MKLILFDVDGILVPAGIVKFDYWNALIKKHFGLDVARTSVYTQGKTDREILFELIKIAGIDNPENDHRFMGALNGIGNIFLDIVKNEKIEKMPGVEELIKILLNKKDIFLGLLTGNTYTKAKIKLTSCGLWKYFNIGAFGDATKVRSELVEIALGDAMNKLKINFNKADVYLVGDTVRDIYCAREAGVKCIAVATGKENIGQLNLESPDYIFNDFNNPKEIASVI